MSNDRTEELIAVGKWLYDNSVECAVHIVQRDIGYGTGDYQDPIEVREDQEGTFYYLKFSNPANPAEFSGGSGYFHSIEAAKKAAEEMCSSLVWEPNGV